MHQPFRGEKFEPVSEITYNGFVNDDKLKSEQQKLMIYDECDWGLNLKENDQFPNWGSLRRLPIGRKNKKSISDDFWTKHPLKSALSSGGVSRYKWIRHHITPRRTLFTPMKHNMGPNPDLVKNSRTTHIQHSGPSGTLSLEDLCGMIL